MILDSSSHPQPEISVIHDSRTDRSTTTSSLPPVAPAAPIVQPKPTPELLGSFGAAAPRWDAKALSRFLLAGNGSGVFTAAAKHSTPPCPATLQAPLPPKEDDSKLSSREKATKTLKKNERLLRSKPRFFDGQLDATNTSSTAYASKACPMSTPLTSTT